MVKFERVLVVLAVVAIALYARFLYRNLPYAAGGPDSGGYMNEAKLIVSGHLTRPVALVRELGLGDSWLPYFMPLGFAPARGASMKPLYPPGLPVHLAAAALAGGWKRAPFLVTPLAAIGCVILMIAVARQLGIPLLFSFVGAAAVAFFPPLLWHAVQPASDVLAMFWALLAMYFAMREWGIAAGIAFAIGVWVRPTNALMAIPLAMAVRFRPRALATIALGALPLIAGLMAWQATLYGSPFRTGYGSIPMSWPRFRYAAPLHSEWLIKFLTPIVFPCGLLVIFDRAVDRWTRWLLFVWFVVFFAFYSFYGFFDGFLSVRFLLPAIPALLFGALLLMRNAKRLLVVPLCIWIIAMPIYFGEILGTLPLLRTAETAYPQYMTFASKYIPRRAIVMTGALSGSFLLYQDRSTVRYDQLDDSRFQVLRAYSGLHDLPWFAMLGEEELNADALRQRFRGDWRQVARFGDVTIYRLIN